MSRHSGSDCIAVVGAGAWGTALANVVSRAGQNVVLWARNPDHAAAIDRTRENCKYLPGVKLRENVVATANLHDLVRADLVLATVPTQSLRSVAEALSLVVHPGVAVVSCAKGIERDTGFLTSEVIAECLAANPPAILSGPSFAHDVARGLPTAVTLAAYDVTLAASLAQRLSTQNFRLYHTTDMRGVEIGGAAKNVLAIAVGIVAGRDLGESAKAALIARGFAELRRFGQAYGAKAETLMGLSGLGDLILTCASGQSRNFSFGLALGRGDSVAQAGRAGLAEGAFTASVLVEMANARGVDMPIAQGVDAVLSERVGIDAAIEELLRRPLKRER